MILKTKGNDARVNPAHIAVITPKQSERKFYVQIKLVGGYVESWYFDTVEERDMAVVNLENHMRPPNIKTNITGVR